VVPLVVVGIAFAIIADEALLVELDVALVIETMLDVLVDMLDALVDMLDALVDMVIMVIDILVDELCWFSIT